MAQVIAPRGLISTFFRGGPSLELGRKMLLCGPDDGSVELVLDLLAETWHGG